MGAESKPHKYAVRPGSTSNIFSDSMDLISLIVTLIVIGVLLWLINTYMPMDRKIRQILNAVVVFAVVVWLLNVLGLMDSIRGIQVGR
jgi:hypothetical protein